MTEPNDIDANETDIETPEVSASEVIAPEVGASEAEVIAKPRAKKRYGAISLIGTAFLASTIGAGSVYTAGTYLSPKPQAPDALQAKLTETTTALSTLRKDTNALKAQLARLKRDMPKTAPATPKVDLSPLEARLNALESKMAETSSVPVDEALLDRLEALKEEGSDALDLSDITARLSTLETTPNTGFDSSALEARIATLEALASQVKTQSDVISSSAQADLTSVPFPEAELKVAIDQIEPSGGWLKQSLKKHISVQSDDNPDYLLELIVKHVESGDMTEAARVFDKLPPEVKSAGQAWRDKIGYSK